MPITHKFVSSIPDDTNPDIIKPSNWNDEHDFDIDLAELTEKSYNSLTDKPINGAVSANFTPANPNTLTSTNYTHFGLGSTFLITPLKSGIVRITVDLIPSAIGTASAFNNFRIVYGTGNPPANRAAASGTPIGKSRQGGGAVAIGVTPAVLVFNIIVTGLSIGTAYWFDIQGQKDAAYTSMAANNIDATLQELPY
jgi:hypothetical protein